MSKKCLKVLCISFRVGKAMPKTPLLIEAQQNYSLCSTTWYYSHETRLILATLFWFILELNLSQVAFFLYFFLQRKVKESIFPFMFFRSQETSLFCLGGWLLIYTFESLIACNLNFQWTDAVTNYTDLHMKSLKRVIQSLGKTCYYSFLVVNCTTKK